MMLRFHILMPMLLAAVVALGQSPAPNYHIEECLRLEGKRGPTSRKMVVHEVYELWIKVNRFDDELIFLKIPVGAKVHIRENDQLPVDLGKGLAGLTDSKFAMKSDGDGRELGGGYLPDAAIRYCEFIPGTDSVYIRIEASAKHTPLEYLACKPMFESHDRRIQRSIWRFELDKGFYLNYATWPSGPELASDSHRIAHRPGRNLHERYCRSYQSIALAPPARYDDTAFARWPIRKAQVVYARYPGFADQTPFILDPMERPKQQLTHRDIAGAVNSYINLREARHYASDANRILQHLKLPLHGGLLEQAKQVYLAYRQVAWADAQSTYQTTAGLPRQLYFVNNLLFVYRELGIPARVMVSSPAYRGGWKGAALPADLTLGVLVGQKDSLLPLLPFQTDQWPAIGELPHHLVSDYVLAFAPRRRSQVIPLLAKTPMPRFDTVRLRRPTNPMHVDYFGHLNMQTQHFVYLRQVTGDWTWVVPETANGLDSVPLMHIRDGRWHWAHDLAPLLLDRGGPLGSVRIQIKMEESAPALLPASATCSGVGLGVSVSTETANGTVILNVKSACNRTTFLPGDLDLWEETIGLKEGLKP